MMKIPGSRFFLTISKIALERIITTLAFSIALLLWMFATTAPSPLQAQQRTSSPAPVAHTVTVENGVNLEVLDWGGTGRPLVFLAGLGATAHDFEKLAPQFTAHHHVYAITRRGFGASSKPAPTVANYSAERMGEDVLIVIQSLKLDHPVLAGQSIAGEEMSWIGSLHPDQVAGLIYLDAVDSYSFYDPAETDMAMDMVDVRRQIDAFEAGEPLSADVLGSIRASAANLSRSAGRMADNVATAGGPGDPAPPRVGLAMRFGATKFTTVHAPMLAIMACPHDFSRLAQTNPKAAATLTARDKTRCTRQIQFLKSHVTSAQVVDLPKADHDVVRSNEADVIRAMNAFLARLH
jgi:non-heme chloroperoxidase